MQYKFKGPGKYVTGGNGGSVNKLKPGDVIDLEKSPEGVWVSRFELVTEEPTAEEIAARQEAMRDEPEIPSTGDESETVTE